MHSIRKRKNARNWKHRRVKTEYLLFTQPGPVRAENRSRSHFCVIEEHAVRRRCQTEARSNAVPISSQRRYHPTLITPEDPAVIDLGPVRREAGNDFVSFVIGQLKRLSARSKHYVY